MCVHTYAWSIIIQTEFHLDVCAYDVYNCMIVAYTCLILSIMVVNFKTYTIVRVLKFNLFVESACNFVLHPATLPETPVQNQMIHKFPTYTIRKV